MAVGLNPPGTSERGGIHTLADPMSPTRLNVHSGGHPNAAAKTQLRRALHSNPIHRACKSRLAPVSRLELAHQRTEIALLGIVEARIERLAGVDDLSQFRRALLDMIGHDSHAFDRRRPFALRHTFPRLSPSIRARLGGVADRRFE